MQVLDLIWNANLYNTCKKRLFILFQSLQQGYHGDRVSLLNSPGKRTAEEEISEDEDDVWNTMDVITSNLKTKRHKKSKNKLMK